MHWFDIGILIFATSNRYAHHCTRPCKFILPSDWREGLSQPNVTGGHSSALSLVSILNSSAYMYNDTYAGDWYGSGRIGLAPVTTVTPRCLYTPASQWIFTFSDGAAAELTVRRYAAIPRAACLRVPTRRCVQYATLHALCTKPPQRRLQWQRKVFSSGGGGGKPICEGP